MDTITCDLRRDLLSELECPVCTEYMLPPILFCVNGHNICPNCKPKLKQCPTCRQPFVNIRNVALEKMARQIEYPCSYWRYGCRKKVNLDIKNKHERVCPYNQYSCPLTKVPAVKCSWRGRLADLKKHITTVHSEWSHEYKGSFITGLVDIMPSRRYCYIIFAYDEIFYRYFSVKNGNFWGVLQYIGPKENAAKFRYKVTFDNNNDAGSITICQVTRSFEESMDDIRDTGKCIKLHYEVVKNFVNSKNNLKFQMEIFRNDDKV